ncbi:uncharacterized protein LOC133832208 [Humulus lupulus]|uniref:uncharacterized protein LOC133832208 n=1 Tax=Humulus lupulus TaxID=3486 RepID=UPI002B4149FF|nr:uncharacterized protein LOC133832208 [Humulus lupulus]
MVENGVPRFKRMYICYSGLRDGFNGGCRPVIGLDGCHIKGVHPGQLLIAVGVDGNNQMFPVAFAMVEIENKDSWSWFVNLLRIDLKIDNSNHWTFITDKQKGLEQALKGMWEEGIPEAEHRHCARHLEKNFIKVFKEKSLKDLLWKVAREVTIQRFEAVMEEIRKINNEAYEWLIAAGPKHWSRSHFRTNHKCDILLNNMCEAFNGTKSILAARDRPIFSMLEQLRIKWELTNIPCSHAVAAIWHNKQDPELYVSKWYMKEYYMKAYSHQIFPIRNQDEWPRSGKVAMVSPICKKQLGRPKKSRKLELDEMTSATGKKLKIRYITIKCSGCGGKGHNFRTCARNAETSAKKNPPKDPGTYARNHNPMPHYLVSSSTQKTSAQETTQQFQNKAQAKQSIRMKPANKQDKGGNILRKKVRVASMYNDP